jgi:hypothetical protein
VIGNDAPYSFYLPEDLDYTIVASGIDSVRFLRRISQYDDAGRLVCPSVDASPDGELVRYRGRLMEGTGYCADSVFGSHMLIRSGRALERPEIEQMGWSYLDHVLSSGFFDDPIVPVLLYRDVETGTFLHNLEARPEYVEFGHIARVAFQLLEITSLDTDPERIARCREIARRTAVWVMGAERCSNGWYARRTTPETAVYPFAPDALGPVDLSAMAAPDPIHDRSGSGVLAIQLLAAATAAGLVDAMSVVRSDVDAFMRAGGHFGCVNTATEDGAENVSYALAFQAMLGAAELLADDAVRTFAYEACLAPLADFELARDYNGVATKGLLLMEASWNAACTWEAAEAAQAYLMAFADRARREHLLKGLTILRAMAKHHHGDWGFLTEAVDWDGHSTAARHFAGERYGDIATTHPFLNNLHVLQPTVYFVEQFALRVEEAGEANLYDPEGNRLCAIPLPHEDWMRA